jgi:tetratricopeptide (TPR) repeat protein
LHHAVNRFLLSLALALVAFPLAAQYVPPVPIGVRGDGTVRKPKAPIPFPAEDESWIRVRSTYFDIVSSADEGKTRGIAEELEKLTAALTQTNPRFSRSPVPTRIFVFEKRKESQPYFDLLVGREKTPVTGLFIRHEGGGTMIIDSERRWKGDRTPLHELVHDLLRHSDLVPPMWFEEGLAEYFSNTLQLPGEVRAGKRIDEHVRLLKGRVPIPLDELFGLTIESAAATTPQFYAQSWAAVHWLMDLDRTRIYDFLADLERGTSVSDALQRNYHRTLKDLDYAIRNSGHDEVVRIPVPPVELKTDAAELTRADILFELGRFLSHISGAETERDRHYQGALQADPNHARTLAATGNFERAAAADPRNPEILLDYAETLMTTAVGSFAQVFEPEPEDEPTFRKARSLVERALTLPAVEEGRARGLLGTTYTVETDLSPGIPHLERANELLPGRVDFALHLYSMYLQTGQRAKADALYERAFARAREKQVIFAAKNALLRSEAQRANALARTGKYDEAAAVVRALATETPDSMARGELERQAEQLEAIGAVNLHIAQYNQAVSLSNTGKTREAIKVLDELLAVAKDQLVIRDATKLRKELLKRAK